MKNINKQFLAQEEPLEEIVFGLKLQDNYRYFEDENNKVALDWMRKQTGITNNFLNKNNLKDSIIKELIELDNFQEFTFFRILHTGNYIYYLKSSHTDSEANIYRYNVSSKKETLLINFSELEEMYNSKISLLTYDVSPNGVYLSFLLGIDGEEFGNFHFYDIEKAKLLDYKIKETMFDICWLTDYSFLYYYFPYYKNKDETKYSKIEIKFHSFDNPKEDFIVFSENKTSALNELGNVWNHYLMYYKKENNKIYIRHIKSVDYVSSLYCADFNSSMPQNFNFKKVFSFDSMITNFKILRKNIFFQSTYFSNENELRYSNIEEFNIEDSTLIKLPVNEFLKDIYVVNNEVYITSLINGYNKLYKIDVKTKALIHIKVETNGSISFNEKSKKVCFSLSNFKSPRVYYSIDKNNIARKSKFINSKLNIDLADIIIKNEKFLSHDGVKVPITFAYMKGLELDGKNKCLINVYGSYGFSLESFFTSFNYRWMKNGGIIAIAHVRGGGEKGWKWHKAGQKKLKYNSWKDLIAAAEYMISKKYTSSPYLACMGTSAGGIAVGMAVNERPELFSAMVSNVGSSSVIRMGKNPFGGIGEFGNPEKEEDFEALLNMDVFQNISVQNYPNVLFTAGMQDSRVDYWKPAKACAKMQKFTTSTNRISLLLFDKMGHGFLGASKKEALNFIASQFAFLESVLE